MELASEKTDWSEQIRIAISIVCFRLFLLEVIVELFAIPVFPFNCVIGLRIDQHDQLQSAAGQGQSGTATAAGQ